MKLVWNWLTALALILYACVRLKNKKKIIKQQTEKTHEYNGVQNQTTSNWISLSFNDTEIHFYHTR